MFCKQLSGVLLCNPVAAWCGKYSYEIYSCHWPVFTFCSYLDVGLECIFHRWKQGELQCYVFDYDWTMDYRCRAPTLWFGLVYKAVLVMAISICMHHGTRTIRPGAPRLLTKKRS